MGGDAEQDVYWFEGFRLDLKRRALTRDSGEHVGVTGRGFDALAFLIQHAGEVVERSALIHHVWPRTSADDNNLNALISSLRHHLGDNSHPSKIIATVSGQGYQFIGQVQDWPAAMHPAVQEARKTLSKAVARLDIGEEVSPTTVSQRSLCIELEKPSIAVLPFTHLSSEVDSTYFADGMVHEITMALTKFSSLFVIAHSSAQAYRCEPRNLIQISKELGVRYLLEGSIRKAGQRVRISVSLSDAQKNIDIWFERFEAGLGDVFALQDKVANATAAQVEPSIVAAEIRRATARPTQDLDAYDLYLRALFCYQSYDKRSFNEALSLLDRVLTLDPHYALALSLAAQIHVQISINGWGDDPQRHLACGREFTTRALRANDHDSTVLARLAYANLFLGGNLYTVESWVERALALSPNLADAWVARGYLRVVQEKNLEEGLADYETALALDPLSPVRFRIRVGQGMCLAKLERFDEALPVLYDAVQLRPESPSGHFWLAYVLAKTDRFREAKAALSAVSQRSIALMIESVANCSREDRKMLVEKIMNYSG